MGKMSKVCLDSFEYGADLDLGHQVQILVTKEYYHRREIATLQQDKH